MSRQVLFGGLIGLSVISLTGLAGAQGAPPEPPAAMPAAPPPAAPPPPPESVPAGAPTPGPAASVPPAPPPAATAPPPPPAPIAAPAPPAPPAPGAAPAPQAPHAARPRTDLELSTLLFLHGVKGSQGGDDYSRFYVGRAYFTGKFKASPWFGARVTMDAHQKKDDGDWSMRLKYAYGVFEAGDFGSVLSGANVEFGMVHTPWLDFEEHVNRYRMQGTMFMERNGLFNSADLGVTAGANIGPKLGAAYTKKVSKASPGTFGSFAVGVYNGGGYAAQEANENKTVEGRLTVRPLGPILPNLQLSYFGIYGKGNTDAAPPWRLNAGMLSFEHEYFVLTGTYAAGSGNQKGDALDGDAARKFSGYSVFGEVKAPWIDSSVFGRFDRFDWDRSGGQKPSDRVIVGAAYWFLPHNAIVADWDWLNEHEDTKPDQKEVKLSLQVELP